jgi:hypothetical protein
MKDLVDHVESLNSGCYDAWDEDAFGVSEDGDPNDFVDVEVEIVGESDRLVQVKSVHTGKHSWLIKSSFVVERENGNKSVLIMSRWLATDKGFI